MLPRIVITSLAAAALIVGTALMPNGGLAYAAHGGAAGGWPPGWSPGQTWPYPVPECSRVQVKYCVHKRTYWRWVERCQ